MVKSRRSHVLLVKNALVKGIYLLTIFSMLVSSLALTPARVSAATVEARKVTSSNSQSHNSIQKQSEETPSSEPPTVPPVEPSETPTVEIPSSTPEEPTLPPEPVATDTPEILNTPTIEPTIPETTSSPTPEITSTQTPEGIPSPTPGTTVLLPQDGYRHKVTSGADFNCFITGNGGVKCMGNNEFGQLGNGTFNSNNIPVDVNGLSENVISLSAGNGHSVCALTGDGAVKCWGDNSNNIFNDGRAEDKSNTPIDVPGFSSGVQSIELGTGHACAITQDNGLFCWGNNTFGQLGVGSSGEGDIDPNIYSAREVSGLGSNVQDVSLGVDFTCAVVSGTVKCWGMDSYGQLGNGESGDGLIKNAPVDVTGLAATVTNIQTGDSFACAILVDGRTQCWGTGSSGQLGNGETANYSTPQFMKDTDGNEFTGARVIASGSLSSCLIKTTGELQCWGDNSSGIFGEDSTGILTAPKVITNLASNAQDVSLRSSICAALDDGRLQCWGSNEFGQLGIGTSGGFYTTPQEVLINSEQPRLTLTPTIVSTTETTPIPDQAILHEWWDDIEGGTVADLVNSPLYQGTPSGSDYLPIFEGPLNYGDNYGARYRGYLNPPVTGDYTFWVNSDDESELSLSSDDVVENKVKIVELNGTIGWSDPSAPIHLEKDKKYYIEALHKEAGGDDYISVLWQIPGETEQKVIEGIYLSPYIETSNNENPDPVKSIITSSNLYVLANDIKTATISVTLKNAKNKPVAGHAVELVISGTNVTIESSADKTDTNGNIQFTIRTGTPQTVSIGAHDTTSNITLSSSVNVEFTQYEIGSVLHEWWTGIEGQSITDLTGNENFPLNPSGSNLLPSFEGPSDLGNNYGERFRGYLNPTVSGYYDFFLASDDDSVLFLSTDDKPSNKIKILDLTGITGVSSSYSQYLEAGNRYYIEALHKQASDESYLRVYWQIPNFETEVINGKYLSPFVPTTDRNPSPDNSTIASSTRYIQANDVQKVTISISLINEAYEPVSGHEVELIHNGSNITIESPSSITNYDGRVQFTLRSGSAQTVLVKARDKTSGVTLNSSVTVEFTPYQVGSILHERWDGIDGQSVSDLTSNPKFMEVPTQTELLPNFEGPTNAGENFGERYRGFIIPSVSGAYNFWIESDDDSELWLSTDDNPGNKERILNITGITGLSESAGRSLVAGKRYYIEALHKQSTGDSYLKVYWQIPERMTGEIITSNYLIPYQEETIDPIQSTLRTSASIISANNSQNAVITVILMGTFSNPIIGHEVEILHNGTDVTIESPTTITNENGQVQFTLRTSSPQTISIQARDKTKDVLLNTSISLTCSSGSVGSILNEVWDGIEGSSVSDLINNPKYLETPTNWHYFTEFYGSIADPLFGPHINFGDRYRGFIYPEVSGEYSFWISSDDAGELWLSSDENPDNKIKIAEVTSSTGVQNWDTYTSQKSNPIYLQAGQKYYIEALHKQSTGRSHLAVAWKIPNFNRILLSRGYISPYEEKSTDPAKSSIKSSNTVLLADNTQKATITVTLLGKTNLPVSGHEVELIHNGNNITVDPASGVTDANGNVQFTVKSGDAQNIELRAQDKTGQVMVDSSIPLVFFPATTGSILREWWLNIPGSGDSSLYDLSKYSYEPAGSEQLSNFEGPTNWQDNYIDRFSGYITAPISGSFKFSIASNDYGLLFLSTDDNPANKVLIKSSSNSSQRNWISLSNGINLQKDKKYYIEVLHKAGTGQEHLSVGWVIPGNAIELISSSYLTPFSPPEKILGDGKLVVENWAKINSISELKANSQYPYFPTGTQFLSRFEASTNISGATNYRGYIIPPLDGDYTFWISSSWNSEFWLSSDASFSKIVKIASSSGNDTFYGYKWTTYPSQQSNPIHLTAGQKYYFTAFSDSITSINALAVAWQIPGGKKEIISGAYLSSVPSPLPIPETNSIQREYWNNIEGGAVSDLTSNSRYPNNPDGREEIAKFEGPLNWGNNYGARYRGYIIPKESGAYTFWISSDDLSELWLSPSYDPAEKVKIAYVPPISGGGNAQYQWNRSPLQQSKSIELTANKKYYIEALHKEGGWEDHLEVGWLIPGINEIKVISGEYLSSYGVTYTSTNPDPDQSSLDAAPVIVAADNTQTSTATISLLDSNGNPVVGHEVDILHDGSNVTITPLSSKTDHEGRIKFTIGSSQAQDLVIHAKDKTSDITISGSKTITFSNIDPSGSLVAVAPASVIADGVQKADLSVTLKNLYGQPVVNKPVEIHLKSGRQVTVGGNLAAEERISIGNTSSEGVATVQVSSTFAEEKLFDVYGDGTLLSTQAKVTFIPGPVSVSKSKFLVEPLTVEADNNHSASISIELKDEQGNPLPNHQINLVATGIAATITQPNPAVTDASGILLATIKSSDLGKTSLLAHDATENVDIGTNEITWVGGAVDPIKSTVESSAQMLKANGTDMALYIVTLMDSLNHPLPGHQVEVTVSGWDNIITGPIPLLTGSDGKVNFSLSSTRAETKTLSFRDKTLGVTLSQTPVITFIDPSVIVNNECVQPVEGLINWWSFNGNMKDLAGGNDGTPNSDIVYAPALVGQGLTFDGINDTVGLGNWFDLQNFSISMWIKPGTTQNAYATLLDNNRAGQNNWGVQQYDSQTNNYGWLGSIGYLSANKWQHLVITHDSSGFSRSYVDGVLTNTTQSGQINYNSSRFLRLGQANSGGYNWKGLVDELAVYNRALTQDEINAIYSSGTAGFCKLTDATQSTVTATSTPLLANNTDTATINVTLKDIYGAALVGHAVSLSISGDGNTITSTLPVLTNQDGEAALTFTSTRAEEKTVTVRNITQGVVLKTKPVVTFIADNVNPDVSTLEADEAAPANNITKAAVTVTLLDSNGNPIAGHNVELTVNGAEVTQEAISSTTDASGKAQFTLRSAQVQTVTVEARDVTSDTRLTKSATVEFVSTDPGISSVTANPETAVADGTQAVTASITLRDIHGQPVAGKPVTLKIKSGTMISINGTAAETDTVSLGDTDASGTVTARITSTKAENKAITIFGDRLKLDQELDISFTPGPVSIEKTKFAVNPLFLVGDGKQEAQISIELKDAFANPISGHEISITSTGVTATLTQAATQTDTDGKLTASIKSAELGNALVKATDTTSNLQLGDPIQVGFVNGLTDPEKSTVTINPISIASDGVEKATITVVLVDSTNHPLPGHEVELTSTGTKDSILGPVPLVTSADGKATFTIASKQSGIKTLTIRDKTIRLALKTEPKITINPGPVSPDKFTLTANPAQAPADGITPITLTATARDINENPVPGVALTLKVSGTTAVLNQSATVTDDKGQITATVKDTVIEKVTANILYNQNPVQATAELSFRGPDLTAVLSGQEKAAPGTQLTYSVFIQNKNLLAADGVNVSLQLPADVTYVSQDSPVEPTQEQNTLKWALGSLAGKNSIQFRITTEISKTAALGSELKATAIVASTMDDGNPDNNTSNTSTTLVDALTSDAMISPTFSSLPIGGETTYTITIRNTGLKVDTYNVTVEGLPSGWTTLDRSLVNLNVGDSLDVHLKVAVNSCQFEEEIPFTVNITSTQAAKTTTLNAKLMVVTAPQVWIDSPGDKSTLGSTSVLFSWRTNPATTGVITLYPEGHPELVQTLNAESGTDHSIKAENLSRNTTYFWKLNSKTDCGESMSGLLQFRVENGIVFTGIPVDFTVDRDYNQILKIYAKNEDVVLHSLKADLINPNEDLIANFVGSGSIDEVINLGPGESRELSLAVHAQDTKKSSYLLTAHLLTDGSTAKPIEDNAKIKVNVLSSGDFTIEEDTSAYDPKFMAHTYIITNKGSTITDLSLKAVDPVTGLPARIFLKPSINHARLERGKTLKVVAYPLFDASDMAIDPSGGLHSEIYNSGVFLNNHKREVSALIKAEGAGNTKTTNAEVNCPAGKNVYEVTLLNKILSCLAKDWYCTNRPDVLTIINSLPNIKATDIESAVINLILQPHSNVLPHSGQVTFNSNKVGQFDNSIPTGAYSFTLPPDQVNSAVAGAVPQNVRITTQHMNSGHYVSASEFSLDLKVKSYKSYVCAASQADANTIKPPLCEFKAAELAEGIQELSVLVASAVANKLSNGGQGDNGNCPYGPLCNAMHVIGDPINTKTGSQSFSVTDLSVPTSAGTLAFQRSYSSAATDIFTGTFSPGWTHNHDARLIFPDDANGIPGYVLFKGILGNLFYFKINEDGTYSPMPGVTASLTRDGQGDTAVYTIKSRAQTGFTFDSKGKALTRSDSQGNPFTYTYDGNGKLSRISADGGQRYIELTYDSQGRVNTATDHTGRQVAYHYLPNGDLNDITDILGKTWSYQYDSAHRITKTSNPDGSTITTDYDMQGRAYRQFDGKGNQIINIVYNADGTTTVTDANGKTSKDTYDKFNTLSGSLDALGGNTSTERDTNYNPTSITDPGGHTTGLVWSADGANLTQVTDAAGQTSSLTYDSLNNLTGVTDTAGYHTRYFYEDSSHPTLVTRIVDAKGTETAYQYDGNGRLIRTTDPLGHSTSYGYDEFGQRTSVTDALGHSTSSSYDNLGRMTDSTGIDGLTTHYEYDVAGHMTKSTRNYAPGRGQNDGNLYNIVTTYEYDSVGNQIAVTDTLGATTRYEYDENNRLVKTIDPAGNETRSVYNAAGQLVESVDALGRTTDYAYDALGRVTVTTAPDGSTTRSEYNPDGTVAASVDASGARTTYTYDELKRTTAIQDAMGNETHTSYDAAGNVQTSTDAMGNVTSYEYDALGRVINTTSPDGSVTHTEYNSAGQTVSTTRNYDAGRGQNDGNIYNLVTSYTYDELGRQKTVTDTLGNTTTYNYDAAGRINSVTDAMGRSTTYEYDSVGRQSAVIDAMGGRSSQTFDVLGRVTASTDMAGRTTSYDFDALGRQTAVTDAAGGRVSYTYDAAGQRLTQTDANGNTTTFTYDDAGRTLTTTDANGKTVTNEYGAGGRLVSVTNGNGEKTRYEYDALGRQTAVTDPLGNVTRYAYNANGQRVMMTDANGISTQYGYDAAGRLTDVIENYVDGAPADAQTNVHTHYAYDLNGSRTSITDGNGNVTAFEYDALGRQTAESDALGHTTRYTYDASGNRATQVDAMGRTTSFEYNARGQLTRIVYPSPDPAVVFSYNDATGQRVSMDDGIGRTTWNYDALGRVTSVTDPFGKTVAYEYDNVGNRTGLTYPDGKVVNYTYDPANRLQVVKDWLDQVTTYGYDSANRLNLVALPNGINSNYTYDSAGHLTNLTHAAQDRTLASYTYTYDATGNRTSAVEDMVTLEGKPPYVSVFVKDTDGNAVVGAPVYAYTGTKYSGKTAATDANGEARLTLPFGNYRFRVDIKDQNLGTNTGQFWSTSDDACVVEGCHKVFVTVNKPVTVTVSDSSGQPQSGLPVYAYLNTPNADGSGYTETYSGISGKTAADGKASLVLPFGQYRFRADLNGTKFWSSPNTAGQMCDVSQPVKVTALQDGSEGARCTAAAVQVSIPFKVTVASTDGDLISGTTVYAFTGTTYSGISAKTDANGEVTFTLPFGNYRFRADYKPEGAASATQFWSGTDDHCTLPGCSGATVTVTKPFAVTVQDTDGQPMPNLAVYAFTGSTYKSYHGVTDAAGKVVFALPQGAYHFRADYNSTKFWSSDVDECVIPGCPAASITVTKPLTVSVTDTDGAAMADISVYAFDGTTYKGYSKKTSAAGQAVFTLPQGSYRFRADYNGTQFWSGAENHCTLPGCTGAGVTLTKPVIVTALDSNNLPAAGISLYAYSDTTYKGYSGKTSAGGQVSFTLPLGSYRFRGDYNGKKYWSSAGNDCALPGCSAASVKLGAVVPTLTPTVLAFVPTVVADFMGGMRMAKPVDVRPRADSASSGPVVVTVQDTDGTPLSGMPVYAFTGATYTGKHGVTNASGQANIILPAGAYRFRSDRNGTKFWSSEADACTVPTCTAASVTVTKPVTITVRDTDGQPQAGIAVYAFDGTTYKSISGKTDANGVVSLTLPVGSYRFRGDLNKTKFWSSETNECTLPGCASASITLTKPVTVTVKDTAGAPKEGLTVYAFDGTTYKSINGKTDVNGNVTLTLPQGAYRFRADLNGTKFWSSETNECSLPGCAAEDITVTIPMTVRVEGVDHSPFEGVKVYAFDGTTYKGYSGTSGKDGQVTFTLSQGNYRFRGDLNGTQFWSSTENVCTLPGCANATITLPGGNTSRSAVTINYTYDGLSRLTAADYSSGDYYHYAYDAVGNRLTETTAKGETAYTYDPANRLTSVNGQAVQWDDNGNMLADGTAVYTYNTANKLVGVAKGTSNIVYAYSGLGDRLKQIADGVTTDYTLDINAGLTQVLQDGKQTYLYGNPSAGSGQVSRIAQIAETQTGYFLPDALGSMRQMTDSSADLTLARTYDPYGNVVSSSGTGETVYGYTGEQQSGGLVHLRARDYASQLGRFTSRDTWEGSSNTPLSYNKWIYAFNNPTVYTDASGNNPNDFPPVSVSVELADSIPMFHAPPYYVYPAQYFPQYKWQNVLLREPWKNEGEKVIQNSHDKPDFLPQYFNLCGQISLEMVFETVTHEVDTLIRFMAASGLSDNETGVGDLALLARGIFPKGFVEKEYYGSSTEIMISGDESFVITNGLSSNWDTTSPLNKGNMKEVIFNMLNKGHYVLALVTLDTELSRITSHDQSPIINGKLPRYVGHWIVVTGLEGDFVNFNNPYNNSNDRMNWNEFELSVRKSGMSVLELFPDLGVEKEKFNIKENDSEYGICSKK